jgi:hypothetical protein
MFSTIWLTIKNWLGGDGKWAVILGIICLAFTAYVAHNKNTEIEKYRQIIEVSEKAKTQEIDIMKKSYESQIKALMEIDKKYGDKLEKLVANYTANMEAITMKQEELYKTYAQNIDVLKLALREMFALEEVKK